MQRAATDCLEATLSYMRPTWNVWLASSYTMTNNQLPGTRDTTGLAESFTTSYRPWNTLTITPSLGYRAAFDQWSGAHLETPTASISLDHQATRRFFVSVLGGYSATHSNDGTLDLDSVNGSALLARTLPTVAFPLTPPIIAVEANYTLVAHHTATVADLQDVSGLLPVIVEEF